MSQCAKGRTRAWVLPHHLESFSLLLSSSFSSQFPHATVVRSSPSRLVQRLERRFGEGKDGLGFEPDSSALASARSGLMRSINSATGHEETHLTPEVRMCPSACCTCDGSSNPYLPYSWSFFGGCNFREILEMAPKFKFRAPNTSYLDVVHAVEISCY